MFEVDRGLLRDAALRLASARGLRWVIGGACSGKSSVCRTISRWTGVPVYDMDKQVYGRYMSRYSASRHPAIDPSRSACLAVDDAESRRIWEEAEDRSGMRRAVERLPAGSERWSTFLTFNEHMSATIEREAREQGITVLARTPGVSLDDLSRAVMGHLGFEPADGSAVGWRGVGR